MLLYSNPKTDPLPTEDADGAQNALLTHQAQSNNLVRISGVPTRLRVQRRRLATSEQGKRCFFLRGLVLAGREACLLKWLNEKLSELRHFAKLHDKGIFTLAAMKQFLAIQNRFRHLAKDDAKVTILSGVDARWTWGGWMTC